MIDDNQLAFMVSLKMPYIITEITREMCVSSDNAFDMFYNSVTYKLLCDKGTYYWGESAQFVAESFMREHEGLPIENFENI